MTTLTDALTTQTSDDILAGLLADAASSGCDVTGFDPLSVERTLPTLDARAQAAAQQIRVAIVNGSFLDTAGAVDPSWLRLLAKGWYQIDWIPATKAVHTFRLTNNKSGGPYTFNRGDLIASTQLGVTFRNSDDSQKSLLAGSGNFVDLTFTADVAGTSGNILPGEIDSLNGIGGLITQIPGVSIKNLTGSLLAAAVDDETNDSLVSRCKSRWGTLGYGGNSAAFRYLVSLAAPTVTRVGVRDDNPFGVGSIALYLANAAGPALTTEVSAVDAYLQPKKPLGSGPLYTLAASAHVVNVGGTIYTDGSNPTALAQAQAALAALASTYPMANGGTPVTLYGDKIVAVVMGIPGVVNYAPFPGDTTLALEEVLQITTTGLAQS